MGEVASKGKVQGAGNAGGAMNGSISGQQRGWTQVLASPAYRGNTAFKEALHVPILPGPDMSGKASLLFPLMDVSGSMHAKLATAKEQICKQFVASTDANAVGMMAFTTEPYLVVPVSGMSSKRDKEEFEKTVKSLFIPSHSGTDIPAALLRYLQEINALLDRVPARSKLEMRKTSCVVITDGLNEVSDGTWNKVSEAVSDTRSRAKKKSCYLFFYLLNLQSSDVDENILQRLSQVLRAERAARAGLQPLQVYDTISQHMVTVEKCVSRISQVKEQLQKMDGESKGQKEHQTLTMTVIETSIKLVKVELKKHQVETQSFDNDLKTFEEETQNIFQVKASLLADDYRSKVQDALKGLQSQLESFDSQMSHVRGAVQSSRDQLQEMAAAALKSQYSQDLDRISVDLAAYEEFLEKSQVASEEMKEDLQETRKVLQEKEGRIIDFMKQNKNDQFDAGRLLARTQKQREKAHSLAKEMKMEAELKSWEFVPTPSEHKPLSECCICFKENGPSFTLFCGHAIFCAGCLAGHVKAKADQNLPAFCPAEGCSHELLQDEVDSFCCSEKSLFVFWVCSLSTFCALIRDGYVKRIAWETYVVRFCWFCGAKAQWQGSRRWLVFIRSAALNVVLSQGIPKWLAPKGVEILLAAGWMSAAQAARSARSCFARSVIQEAILSSQTASSSWSSSSKKQKRVSVVTWNKGCKP